MPKNKKKCPRELIKDLNSNIIEYSKDGTVKYQHSINDIHQELITAENLLRIQKIENIEPKYLKVKLSKNSIWAKIWMQISSNGKNYLIQVPIRASGEDTYDIQNFDQENTEDKGQENINDDNRFDILKNLYNTGRKILGTDSNSKNKCGITPKFKKGGPYAQFLYHSEKALYGFLSLDKNIDDISSRLINKIKSIIDNDFFKVHTLGLAIHSTKTPCGACENSSIGFLNKKYTFERIIENMDTCLKFKKSSKLLFKPIITFTANNVDANHCSEKKNSSHIAQSITEINVKQDNHSKIFLCKVENNINKTQIIDKNYVASSTVFLSGSSYRKDKENQILATPRAARTVNFTSLVKRKLFTETEYQSPCKKARIII